MRRAGAVGKIGIQSKGSASMQPKKRANFDNRKFFPSIHYGIYNFVRDENPVDAEVVDSPNLKNYMFVAESSGGTDAADPVSKIWVYDVSTPSANPSSFVWTVDPSDVPDFKNANEILINGNDIYIVYYWRFPDNTDTNPSRLVKFTNVSIDFSGNSVSYDSAEDIELTGLPSVHYISKDSTYGYVTCRRNPFGGPYSFETKVGRFPLSGALSSTAISIVDGGKEADGVTDQEWFGDLYNGSFNHFNGLDYLGCNDACVYNGYMYLPVTANATEGNVLWSYSTRDFADGIGRVDLSDIANTLELVWVIDGTKYLYGVPTAHNSYLNIKAKGGFLYVYTSRGSFGHVLMKINLSDPREVTYKSLYYIMSEAPAGGDGYAHSLRIWKDKLVLTNAGNAWVGVFNQSDLSEVGHVWLEDHIPSLSGVGITDDFAIVGDYAYLPVELSVKKLYSLNLNEINDPTITEINSFTNDPYAAVYYDNIL